MNDFEKLIESASQGSIDGVRAVIENHPQLINQHDPSGATALHYAAYGGHRTIAELLVKHGAHINARDEKYKATPAGWAIEYLRKMGAFLGIELSDFAFAIRRGDVEWTARFLRRFPRLRDAADEDGTPFRALAMRSGNAEIASMFDSQTPS